MAGNKQGPLEKASIYQPPWRTRLPDGSLGEDYGPSPQTYQRHKKAQSDWAWKPVSRAEKHRRLGEVIADWLDDGGWQVASERELDVFNGVWIMGMTNEETAKWIGISSSTVRVLKSRLVKRVWSNL